MTPSNLTPEDIREVAEKAAARLMVVAVALQTLTVRMDLSVKDRK